MGYILSITADGYWSIERLMAGRKARRIGEYADYELAEATRKLLAASLN